MSVRGDASGAAMSEPVIPLPSPGAIAMFHNTNRNSLSFLRAVGIQPNSKEHKDLMITIRALYHQHLNPFKYLEEQELGCVDKLIAKAQVSLPWLRKFEDSWPARIYLKRYVDSRRPHLMCTRYAHRKKKGDQNLPTPHAVCPWPSDNPQGPGDMPDHDSGVKEFLGSLAPTLEHHLDAFVELGVKDQKTLEAFLSWPQVTQSQFLDDGHGVMPLTNLEKQGLLLGCSLLVQMALRGSLAGMMKPGCFRP